jgi:hypothetical protein
MSFNDCFMKLFFSCAIFLVSLSEWNAFSVSSCVVKASKVVVNVNAMSQSYSLCKLELLLRYERH